MTDEENQDSLEEDTEPLEDESGSLQEPESASGTENSSEEEDIASEIEALLIEGEDASRANDIKGALSSFNKAIALDPSCDMAWFNRGVLLEAQQDARGARQSFQICLDLNPDHAPATANMAILLERIGDLEGAYETAKKALEFFPGHPALIDVQKRCKDSGISIAIESMKPSITPSQTYDDNEMQEVLQETGVESVEEVLAEAVHHDDDANQHLDIEELRSAATMVAAKSSLSPAEGEEKIPEDQESSSESDFDEILRSAIEHFEQQNFKEAFKLLKPHLKTVATQNARAWSIAGQALAELGHLTHAIASLTHAQNLESDDVEGWLRLATLHENNQNRGDARICFQKVIDLEPQNKEALNKLNSMAKDDGQIEEYLDTLRTLSSIGNEISKHQLVEALLSLAEGESNILENTQGIPPTLPAGPELAEEALTLIDDVESGIKARALSLANQHRESITLWKKLLQSNPTSDHWTGLARTLERAGELEKAQKCHEKARELAGGVSELNALNQTLQPSSTSQRPEEIKELNKQHALQETIDANAVLHAPIEPRPARHEANENPEIDLAKAALDATAASEMNQIQSTQSSSIANHEIQWYNQGIQLLEQQKYREALSSFDKALSSFQNDEEMIIRILNNRGNAYYFLEEFPKCIESYHQAMMIRPTEVKGQTLYNMGAAYAAMERYSDAIKCFNQAIPRGLDDATIKVAKDQIRRCEILKKQLLKKKR